MARKLYLGDGVYLEQLPGALVLTTENGFRVTNRIVLESAVLEALLLFVRTMRGTYAEQP